jgi:hypothetical protein
MRDICLSFSVTRCTHSKKDSPLYAYACVCVPAGGYRGAAAAPYGATQAGAGGAGVACGAVAAMAIDDEYLTARRLGQLQHFIGSARAQQVLSSYTPHFYHLTQLTSFILHTSLLSSYTPHPLSLFLSPLAARRQAHTHIHMQQDTQQHARKMCVFFMLAFRTSGKSVWMGGSCLKRIRNALLFKPCTHGTAITSSTSTSQVCVCVYGVYGVCSGVYVYGVCWLVWSSALIKN